MKNELILESLLANSSLYDLASQANDIRTKLHDNKAFYTVNGAITYSNTCELFCPICSFAKKKDSKQSYILSLEQVEQKARYFSEKGAVEVHIIGGINHDIPFDYYIDVLKTIRRVAPNLNIVAFTASECVMMSEITGKSLEYVYKSLIDAGLDALPGGGAEIFNPRVRNVVSPKKLSGKAWLEGHRQAHKCGLKTNATMLYGHVEDDRAVANHLQSLRNLQEETNGFKAIVLLPFRKGESVVDTKLTSQYSCKICSLTRIALDNVPHIRVPVTHFSDRFAQLLLNFGADDIGGTHWAEEVASSAGANFKELSEKDLADCITSAGFKAIRTNSNYV
ncbi:MAG: CofH family radical SAM protein [Opitutales bacterium]